VLPALAARGDAVHVGPAFAGSVDLAADADLIAGGLLLELKVNSATAGSTAASAAR
jgi:hypothetical protein